MFCRVTVDGKSRRLNAISIGTGLLFESATGNGALSPTLAVNSIAVPTL
jgi:hypothetical protein